jgi:hypothetical protein
MDTIKVSGLCSAGTIVKSHTVPGHTGASPEESDDYGIGLCEAETTADWVQWTMNSCKCSVSPMMLSCTHNHVLWFCNGVTAFQKPLGYYSIILMNSTWLPSLHTSHFITSSSGYGLHTLPQPDLSPLQWLQHGQAETFQVCKFAFHLVLNSILALFFFS